MNRVLKENLVVFGIVMAVAAAVISYGIHENNNRPNCPAFDTKSVETKFAITNMGTVSIEGEDCHVIEVKQHTCYVGTISNCKGDYLFCEDKVVSRLTKCPSGMVTNSISQTGGKSSHEEVQ